MQPATRNWLRRNVTVLCCSHLHKSMKLLVGLKAEWETWKRTLYEIHNQEGIVIDDTSYLVHPSFFICRNPLLWSPFNRTSTKCKYRTSLTNSTHQLLNLSALLSLTLNSWHKLYNLISLKSASYKPFKSFWSPRAFDPVNSCFAIISTNRAVLCDHRCVTWQLEHAGNTCED